MSGGPEVMFAEEQQQIAMVCQRLQRDANAKAVLLIGRDGQPIAEAGDVEELDVTSLSSLTAGNVAATGGISKILREKDFTSQFHEGEKIHVHITLVGGRGDPGGAVRRTIVAGAGRLRVKKSSDEMGAVVRSGGHQGQVEEPAVDPHRDHGQGHRQSVQRLGEAVRASPRAP